ncbi:MAG: DUF1028 domain-containing protein [Candidatus Bathyarchaeota archaeon]|nr:DUF1028 domain-containing protein [Candidatus Bathyarchaeota archaeon]
MRSKYFLGDSNSTFSIVARCPETLALGVSVSSASIAVGSAVPHVEPNVGALAVQGYTNFSQGVNGLRLLRSGLPPEAVINALLERDHLKERRQISIIDSFSRKVAFTGRETLEWRGHIIGRDCVAAGNALTSGAVLEAMVEAFEKSEGEWLAERLMRALEAGQMAGGDRRGNRSAALLVAEREPIHESRPMVNLRVDLHSEPIKKLRRIFEAYKSWLRLIR